MVAAAAAVVSSSSLSTVAATSSTKYPIRNHTQQIVDSLRHHDVLIVEGDTGCGKSSQLPQIIFENGLHKGFQIACSQPRRVAAISLANYVAHEMNNQDIVGYSVRFDKRVSPKTVIKYHTDGMLLREAMDEANLDSYSFILIDECHERSVNSEICIAILKRYLKKRNSKNTERNSKTSLPKLKLVIMSATMDTSIFSKYFWDAPIISISGKSFGVDTFRSATSVTDSLSAAIEVMSRIHRHAPIDQHILCFLAGQDEIEATARQLDLKLNSGTNEYIILKLFASLPLDQQNEVFKIYSNKRKIIISTNIAETSLTIPDIVHIVDCGRAKVKNYTSGGFESLKVQRISKASTKQRAGRAGRVSHGYCYQLFGEKQYEKFEDFTVPEILRIPLENAFLQIAACGIDKVQDFEFLESPTNERIYEALRRLKQNNLLIFADGSQKLSEIGHFCSLFPLPIEMSLTIYHAFSNGSLQQVIQIIAMLSCDSMPFQNEQNEGTDSARNSFYLLVSKYGDHLTYLNCYKFYKKCLKSNKNNKKLAEFGLNESHLQHAHKVLLQIREIISKNFQDVKFNQEVNELHILRSFLFGFKANLMKLSESKTFYNKINDTHEIFIHPQSTMFKSKSKYVIFGQVVETKKCYARIVSYIDEDWLDD